jgi:hypothetical protein
MAEGETLRFGTLTLEASDEPLNSTLNHLLASYKRLRKSEIWMHSVDAAAAVVELTRGKKRDHWHVHIHFLACGRWMDVYALREAWREASGGSFIVHLRAVCSHKNGVGYLAKYATKGWDSSVLEDPDALIECITALRGRRLLVTSGEWYNRDELEDRPPFTDWKHVGYLRTVYAESLAGKVWAVECLRSLNLFAGSVAGEPAFVGEADAWSDTGDP